MGSSLSNDWIWLHIPCPVDGCTNINIKYWHHINCPSSNLDHDIKINSDGYLKCNACNISAPLFEWGFNCGELHPFKNATNMNKIIEILQIMNKATTDQKFISKMTNIGKNYLKNEVVEGYNSYLKIE